MLRQPPTFVFWRRATFLCLFRIFRIMLRKAIRIVFLTVFALLSSGVVATLHLCQDQIKGLEWFAGETAPCPCNESDMEDGCCDTLIVQHNQDEAATQVLPEVPADSIVGEIKAILFDQDDTDDFLNSSLGLQAREPVPLIPIWLSNHSLRIPDAC